MITEKEIRQSRQVIQDLIKEGAIVQADVAFVTFFMTKAENSLHTAKALLQLSTDEKERSEFHLPKSYDGYQWVINTSYYAMFYAATALLAQYNHRIKKEESIHALTYHALIHYFLDNDKKLAKHIIEQYQDTGTKAAQLLQIAEKNAKNKVEQVKYELNKRREFTYDMGKIAERDKAETSIKRAEEFLTLAKELIL